MDISDNYLQIRNFFFSLLVFAIVFLALFALVAAQYDHGDGRPGCRTQGELNTREWRNNFDPTAFWICETLNVAARHERCESVHGRPMGFMTGAGCVEWENWVWVEPVNPPSQP